MGFLSGLSSAFGMAGALLGENGVKEQNAQNQAFAQKQWQQNYNAQKEFAQNGIRWKVEDAKAAGLHPLAALGVSGSSYAPVNTQSYYENEQAGLGNALSNMGQDISRAVGAKQTRAERAVSDLRDMTLFDLDVRQKEADIALTNARISALTSSHQQQVPPLPSNFSDDGALITGQAQSYPNSLTSMSPVEVSTSYEGGYSDAGMNPDVSYNKGRLGPILGFSDNQTNKLEENFFGKLGWYMRNYVPAALQLTQPPQSVMPSKKGYVRFFNPATSEYIYVKTPRRGHTYYWSK